MKNIKINETQKAKIEGELGRGKIWVNPNNEKDVREYYDVSSFVFSEILDEDELTTSEKKGINKIKMFYSQTTSKITISDRDLNSGTIGLFKREIEPRLIKIIKGE